jgi:hypothetical protein
MKNNIPDFITSEKAKTQKIAKTSKGKMRFLYNE